jgi:endonuclease/exonuclease/phosphatase family metal-dependent hydrolase
MLLRAVGLGGIELLLALSDLVRGVLKGNSFIKELTFIPARVGICVMLRELISAQVMIDAARGVPIIHANFLGYDEQSHRRGPDSAFAHWTLSGIDNSIFRIYKSAHLSAVRDYDLWIYSDHGQERVVSYQRAFGKCFKSAVIEALQTVGISQVRFVGSLAGVQLKRVLLLGGAAVLRRLGVVTKPAAMDAVSLIANGPIGHLYLPGQLGDARRKLIGEVLVGRAHIPMVLARGRWGEVDVWTSEGAFRLPRDAQVVIGAHHPLLAEVAEDVRALMHHPDSGTFVLAGYRPNQRIISFVEECGAHAGMGPDETRGFALLPSDAPVERGVQQSMRPVELREAALRFMGRLPGEVLGGCKSGRVRTSGSVRVMSYNTHGCRGLDGRVAPERIARIIAHYEPDIVGLQELDVGRMRSGGVDQAQVIGALLNMRYHFHPSYHIEEERYGSAVLSRLPLRLIKAGALPYTIGREPRGALWVEVELGRSRVIQFITTHFGLSGVERCKQAEELLGAQWIQSVHCTHPVVLCGDFNFLNSSAPYRMVAAHLSDASRAVKKEEQPKVGSYMGVAMVDYIFHSRELRVERVFVANNRLVRAASDHYPLCADLLCAG